MSNPQGPGKQGRKDAKAKAPQPHQTGAPGRSEHQQHGARPQSEHGHTQHRPHPSSSHPSQSIRERENVEEDE
jgi:hypothetical protein